MNILSVPLDSTKRMIPIYSQLLGKGACIILLYRQLFRQTGCRDVPIHVTAGPRWGGEGKEG